MSILFPPLCRGEIDPYFKPLAVKLVKEGFPEVWINQVFDSSCMTFFSKPLRLRLTVRESKRDYSGYLQKNSIKKSKSFMKAQKDILSAAERETNVPREIITAILLLETRFGDYHASFPALRTLASHASADQPEIVDLVYNQLSSEDKKRWSREAAASRLQGRAPWFMGELKALLIYLQETGAAPCDIKGSYTGAIGLCQFQPSNLKPYGRDGDSDGLVNLFQIGDAIMSSAFYLQQHGWKPGLSRESQMAVIKKYNNSDPYARTILDVAEMLKK